MAARERTEPTTPENAPARLRQLQDLLGAMRFSGAFVGLEKLCPPPTLAAMMRAQAAGQAAELPALLSPCLLALGTLGPLPPQAQAPNAPAGEQPPPPQPRPAGLPGPGPATARLASPPVPMPATTPPREPVAVPVSLPTTATTLTVTPAVAPETAGQPELRPTTVTARNGAVQLTLTDTPVYIEETPRTAPPTASERLASPFGAHPATYRGETPPFALAHDLGLGWHRGVAWWVDIQSDADLAAGRFDFSRLDAQLSAMGPDMRALLTIMLPTRLRQAPIAGPLPDVAGAPPGATGPLPAKADGTWELGPPPAAYDAFVKALVTRYGLRPPAGIKRVGYWQFENELDLSRARSDAAGYAALLTRTETIIKRLDPQATILIGGISGENYAHNLDASYLPVLRQLHGRGFDVFDMHFFGQAGDYRALAGLYERTRRTLDATGFARVPIWMTETATYSGAPAIPPGLPPQTGEQQAAELVRRAVFSLGLGVKRVFWAMVREGFHYRNALFDHVGLTTDPRVSPDRPDGSRKPAYFAYRLLCTKLAGCHTAPTRLDLGPGVFAYRFRTPAGRTVVVAWADPRP